MSKVVSFGKPICSRDNRESHVSEAIAIQERGGKVVAV
jgi:hypothetical protein